MKKVMVFLDDETGDRLKELADNDYRSVKAMAEKILMDNVKRSDGLTDTEYVNLNRTVRSGK